MGEVAGRRITRFIVMAILQAARARKLGLPLPSACSWGLNRAIFYAAAKQGFVHPGGGGGPDGSPEGTASGAERRGTEVPVGDDHGYRDPTRATLYFVIGGKTQTEREYAGQIEARFGTPAAYARAWAEAEAIIGAQDPEDLRSGRRFYASVYKPRRDALRERWSTFLPAAGPATPSSRAGPQRAARRRPAGRDQAEGSRPTRS